MRAMFAAAILSFFWFEKEVPEHEFQETGSGIGCSYGHSDPAG
ncbi:Hypothetical protein BSUIS_A1072 [Brucella suis ATCC 23445]|uniref:Uncharacterized protein n=1 Tax=Brucella suis (strain ATCC 23445 / NCTC 10510) TaxID=470137 RepID=B0CGI0_BRUSI|nr:Hypothetical protein BSUIS_A1072 [Brucella suis ATCC 23445]